MKTVQPIKDQSKSAKAKPDANVRVADQIALRAYEIFQSRGGAHGSHLEDWLLAERELDAARGGETARADDK
jgi:hypothetical protein